MAKKTRSTDPTVSELVAKLAALTEEDGDVRIEIFNDGSFSVYDGLFFDDTILKSGNNLVDLLDWLLES